MPPSTQGKIAFANQLRGLAVLLVVFSHYTGTFWYARSLVSEYIFAPAVEGPPSTLGWYFALPTVNYGPLGVAIFFLISGFVIPFSVEKLGPARFLAARLLRIYPTYWVASAAALLVVWFSGQYWGRPMEIDAGRLIANLLLVHNQAAQSSMDLVNWTLAVEIKFYIAALLLWPLIRRRPVLIIVSFTLVLWAYLRWLPKAWNTFPQEPLQLAVALTNTELLFLPYLFIGSLFHLALTKKISPRVLVAGVITVFYLFLAVWKRSPWSAQLADSAANYAYALVIFSVCYRLRGRFRANRVLDFFADVSYPLYIIHSLFGYAVMRILMDQGVSFIPAALLAFAAATGIAYLIHRAVELPTAAWGKRLARRPMAPPTIPESAQFKV